MGRDSYQEEEFDPRKARTSSFGCYVPYDWRYSRFYGLPRSATSYDFDVESALAGLATNVLWQCLPISNFVAIRNEASPERTTKALRKETFTRNEDAVAGKEPAVSEDRVALPRIVSSVRTQSRQKKNAPSGVQETLNSSSLTDWAAVTVQAGYRGHMIRKSRPLAQLRYLAAIEERLQSLTEQARGTAFLEEMQKEQSPVKVRFDEATMALLLKLDNMQGCQPFVRQIRKTVAEDIIALQKFVDAPMQQLRELVGMEQELKKLKEQAGDPKFLEELRNEDSTAKIAFGDATLALLLQFKDVQASHPVVRQRRTSVREGIVALQESLDPRPLAQLRSIAEIQGKVTKLKEQIGDAAVLADLRKEESKAKIGFDRATMALLLQLDNMQSPHDIVRRIRKATAREIVDLQERVDALLVPRIRSPPRISSPPS